MIVFKETVYFADGETKVYEHKLQSIPKLIRGLSRLMPELTNETFYELAKSKQCFVEFGNHRRKWEVSRDLSAVPDSSAAKEDGKENDEVASRLQKGD